MLPKKVKNFNEGAQKEEKEPRKEKNVFKNTENIDSCAEIYEKNVANKELKYFDALQILSSFGGNVTLQA